jgi:radical SAM superfamily enzyme YgiQ (UPF0313 family)
MHVIYVLSSRYDDEGYVLRYWRGILPSNSLVCLSSLTRDAANCGEYADEVDLTVEIYDDTVQRIPIKEIIRRNQNPNETLVVGFVAVQTNQFPRASDLALQLRRVGVPVLMGGFHVSGMLAMFGHPTPELQRLIDSGVSLVKGEVEAPGVLYGILRDALEQRMRPIYDITPPPNLYDTPVPRPNLKYLKHFKAKNMGTIDSSRGCPFNCSFCTIINVQGRKMRHRSAEAILTAIEANFSEGINFYFFTDDNLSRSPVWEKIFDGLSAMRNRGINISFMMQVDTQAYKIDRFVKKAAEAGCFMVFVGMESVNPNNVKATGKAQNKAGSYIEMVDAWRDAGVLVHVGYIIGLPYDTPDSVHRDIETLRNEVKVDEASFFMLTPLPGSRDHFKMVEEQTPMDADYNSFDSTHETFRHPNFEPGQWHQAYRDAYQTFYSKENIVNILLRTPRKRYWQMLWISMWYRFAALNETHPMFVGIIRLKDRKSRRTGFARESRLRYGLRRWRDFAHGAALICTLFFDFQEIWLLTRKRDDPRWKTLADLRAKWGVAQRRIWDRDAKGRCDEAATEIRLMLETAREQFLQLSTGSKRVSRRVQKRLRGLNADLDHYLRTLDLRALHWHDVVQAEHYINEHLLARYEELAIGFVEKRRRFNMYRNDQLQRLKAGRILSMDVGRIPAATAFEIFLGFRFLSSFLIHL